MRLAPELTVPVASCLLRLGILSGIPRGDGDVAEWLKAAVC